MIEEERPVGCHTLKISQVFGCEISGLTNLGNQFH